MCASLNSNDSIVVKVFLDVKIALVYKLFSYYCFRLCDSICISTVMMCCVLDDGLPELAFRLKSNRTNRVVSTCRKGHYNFSVRHIDSNYKM